MKISFELDGDNIINTLESYPSEYMRHIYMEEHAEVIQAISKYGRMKYDGNTCDKEHILSNLEEEIADTIIVLGEMIMSGMVDQRNVQSWIMMKQERLARRIEQRK